MEKRHVILGLALAAGIAGLAILANTDKGKSIRTKMKKKGLSRMGDWKHKMQRYAESNS